jgi:hypothetical protein
MRLAAITSATAFVTIGASSLAISCQLSAKYDLVSMGLKHSPGRETPLSS